MPVRAGFEILRQARDRGVRRVTFAGGEPTLHKGLGALLRRATEFGLITSLVTNGSRLERDACRQLFPWLRWLVLSSDSPNPEKRRLTDDAESGQRRELFAAHPRRKPMIEYEAFAGNAPALTLYACAVPPEQGLKLLRRQLEDLFNTLVARAFSGALEASR